MSTHLHSPNTPSIQENSATFRVVGALAKRRLNFGVGSQDSEYPFDCSLHFFLLIVTRFRAFAELLEHGTGSTLILPIHKPALPAPASAPPGMAELDALRVLGLSPANALQHPGFYYYAAAQATERRRAQFHTILEISETGETNFPGLANERKVEHFGIVVEVRRFRRVWYSAE
jgi:hypothetical protein